MRVSQCIACDTFPCLDVNRAGFAVPDVDVAPEAIRMVLLSEAAPADPAEGYYAAGEPLFARTTLQAFAEAGAPAASMRELLERGIYCTTAVKCAKTAYALAPATGKECSQLLERELALFPNARVLMLMGDVAIKAVNAVATRAGEPRVIPAGATYKIRAGEFHFRGMRVFPSYLQAGPAYFIEASKRRMIAEDLGKALVVVRQWS